MVYTCGFFYLHYQILVHSWLMSRIVVKYLVKGHKCHDRDSKSHSADQKHLSLSPVLLTARPRHATWKQMRMKMVGYYNEGLILRTLNLPVSARETRYIVGNHTMVWGSAINQLMYLSWETVVPITCKEKRKYMIQLSSIKQHLFPFQVICVQLLYKMMLYIKTEYTNDIK